MAEPLKRDKPTIMVVEDDPTTEQSLIDCLSDLGNVVTFSNAENALNFASRGGRVDLVISDIVLGQMNGIELCERLSQLYGSDQLVPVIFYSAFADSSMERLAYQAGGLDFIEKPMSFARLQLRVRSFIEISRRFKKLKSSLALDPMTGLMQRDTLIERGSIGLIKRLFSGATAALFVIDVEDLADLNATAGYLKGDRLLQELANKLQGISETMGAGADAVELFAGRHLSDQLLAFLPACSSAGADADGALLLRELQLSISSLEEPLDALKLYIAGSYLKYDDDLRPDRAAASELIHSMIEHASKQLSEAKSADSRCTVKQFNTK